MLSVLPKYKENSFLTLQCGIDSGINSFALAIKERQSQSDYAKSKKLIFTLFSLILIQTCDDVDLLSIHQQSRRYWNLVFRPGALKPFNMRVLQTARQARALVWSTLNNRPKSDRRVFSVHCAVLRTSCWSCWSCCWKGTMVIVVTVNLGAVGVDHMYR
jgi:hypothetical protein